MAAGVVLTGEQEKKAEIVLVGGVTLLGPESEYSQKLIKLQSEYAAVVAEAKKMQVVDSPEAATKVNGLGRLLQVGTKEAENFFKPIKSQIDSLKAPVLAAEKAFTNELETEKKRLGGLLTAYNAKVQREKDELERKLREEAERLQREEQLARAIELEAAGEVEQAEAVLEEEMLPPPVVIQAPVAPRVAGQVAKTTYSAKVNDFKALVRAVVEGKAPWACIVADESFLNGKARLEKEGFDVPGCELDRTIGTHFRA